MSVSLAFQVPSENSTRQCCTKPITIPMAFLLMNSHRTCAISLDELIRLL